MAVQVSERAAYLQVGYFVDAMDSSQRWLAASIKEVDPAKGVLIQFDGWSSKWNEWLSMRSSRLAPFRRHSRGYGGQQSVALRDWTFTSEEVTKAAEVLDQALAGDLTSFSTAYDITQWFRGHLFTLVDNLLGAEYTSEAQVLQVLPFFEKTLTFGVKWLREMPAKYAAIYQNITNPDAFLTDKDCAYAEIWPELFRTVERLLGSDVRLLSFFKSDPLLGNRDLQPNSEAPNTSLMDLLVGKLDALGGFATILSLLADSEV